VARGSHARAPAASLPDDIALIMAGALGNLIDRIRLGYVIDYINVLFINFPVFNIADCFVVMGAILLGICILTMKEVEKP
jgi:signal peptidase II